VVSVFGLEGDVESFRYGPLVGGLGDREVVPLDVLVAFARAWAVEQFKREPVERGCGVAVGDADPDVIDHLMEATSCSRGGWL
jgi:hypothetical protein